MQQTAPRQHPAVVLRSQYEQLKSLLAVLLIALVSVSVTVVAVVVQDSGTPASTASKFQPLTRSQASVETAKPDESKVAAAIGKRVQLQREAASRPDEAKVAASVSKSNTESYGGFHTSTGRPDEAKIAVSVSPTIHHN
jgi:hypothetical protein